MRAPQQPAPGRAGAPAWEPRRGPSVWGHGLAAMSPPSRERGDAAGGRGSAPGPGVRASGGGAARRLRRSLDVALSAAVHALAAATPSRRRARRLLGDQARLCRPRHLSAMRPRTPEPDTVSLNVPGVGPCACPRRPGKPWTFVEALSATEILDLPACCGSQTVNAVMMGSPALRVGAGGSPGAGRGPRHGGRLVARRGRAIRAGSARTGSIRPGMQRRRGACRPLVFSLVFDATLVIDWAVSLLYPG
jgi:hypothetical protein